MRERNFEKVMLQTTNTVFISLQTYHSKLGHPYSSELENKYIFDNMYACGDTSDTSSVIDTNHIWLVTVSSPVVSPSI